MNIFNKLLFIRKKLTKSKLTKMYPIGTYYFGGKDPNKYFYGIWKKTLEDPYWKRIL